MGVDLAWGGRAQTGLAVLDATGVLREVSAAGGDADVLSWLRRWTAGPCLVAFDAPLVVTNPSGQRACEALVGRHFGRYGARCHPTNTANPAFADGGRAARLARLLGLDADPFSTRPRRAVEVYPHPAIVVLFDLPRVLRYKAKPGRDLGLLRNEMLRLIGLLEGLGSAGVPLRPLANPAWREIRHTVTRATRKSHLRGVEDMVDGVICAYIAAYATVRPEAVRLLGTADGGCILTPVTPTIARLVDTDSATTAMVTGPVSGGRARSRRPTGPPGQPR